MAQFTIASRVFSTASISPSLAVPAAATGVTVVFNNEILNGQTFSVLIEESFDGGSTWRHSVSNTGMVMPVRQMLNGNPGPDPDPHPIIGYNIDPSHRPTHVRVTLTPTGSITLGAIVTVV